MHDDVGSITQWLLELQRGVPQAADEIWKRVYGKLVRTASRYLQKSPDHAVDGEDVAQSAFRKVCVAVMDGRYPDLENREDLWRLLFVATLNRVRRHYRDLKTQKRSHEATSSLEAVDESLIADLRSPAAEAEMADLIAHLLDRLDQEDPSQRLRKIAILYLDGFSANEIAKSVQRRKTNVLQDLRLIRILWQESEEL
ncbi:MAG: ECF-type sigma factor [Planctomycetota bacterium]